MDKMQNLYEKVIEIINWAEYQGHINEDGATLLIQNITRAKEELEK